MAFRKAVLQPTGFFQQWGLAMRSKPATQLVIFDKDGTLIDFSHMWGRWAERLCTKLSKRVQPRALSRVSSALHYNCERETIGHQSPICCTPMHQIFSICRDALATDMEKDHADKLLSECWGMPDLNADCRPLTDLVSLFSTLKNDLNVKIAVCTTDNRKETMKTLENLGVQDYVSMTLCGDDKHLPPKPSPKQILHICEKLGVGVDKTIMVGDTITDMKMARDAGVSLSIGIPFGAGPTDELLKHADVVLPSMHRFLKVVDPTGYADMQPCT